MMKISYKKLLNSSYMAIENPGGDEYSGFQLKMLKNNSISGLLKTDFETLDGISSFLYDISSKYALSKLFEADKISYQTLKKLISSLKGLADTLPEYLLDFNQLIFDPNQIFMDRDRNHFFFCYLPVTRDIPPCPLQNLFNSLLSMIDYDDPQTVSLAFNLNKLAQKDNFSLDDFSFSSPASSFKNPGDCNVKSPATPASAVSAKPVSSQNPRFVQKAKTYFKGKSFLNVLDDVNNGALFKKIRLEEPSPLIVSESHMEPSYLSGFDIPASPILLEEPQVSNTLSLSKADLFSRKLSGTGSLQGIVIDIKGFPFTIGKSEKADYQPETDTVSRIHCRIYEDENSPGNYEIEDENSTNGTYINGKKLEPYTKTPLVCGDLIRLAACEFYFR